MSLIRTSAPSAAQARGELGAAYVAMLVAMLVALHFVAIVTGCCPATTLNSFQVKAKLSGATVILTAGSNWTQRDVIAALEAKTGRSLRGCYLKILARGGKTLHGGKKARKLGALLLRKDSVIEVWHRMHGGMGCAGSKVAPLDVQLQEEKAEFEVITKLVLEISPSQLEEMLTMAREKGERTVLRLLLPYAQEDGRQDLVEAGERRLQELAAEAAAAERAAMEKADRELAVHFNQVAPEKAEAEAEMRAALPSAAKALEAAVQAYGIAPGPPEAQALALAQKGLWPESWDGGETWHEEGNKEKALPAAVVEAELAAKAAVEAQNREMFGTIVPNSDAAAKYSHASWVEVPSALPEDTAPSARLVAPEAQLAPTVEPRAQPEPLEGWPWPQ